MTDHSLHDLVSVRGRFARSVRSDADASQASQLDGYLPTARALEVTRRLVNAMLRGDGARAFSITGPYGSGKSSLAVFLDALLGRTSEDGYASALSLLVDHDADTAELLDEARRCMGADAGGFVRAVVTAPQREPITTTVLRALVRGARRARVTKKLRDDLDDALARSLSEKFASPSFHEVRELLERLTTRRPVLLIIDEFGKNLEAYAESGSDGDLYLLQELAEWASGVEQLPLVLVTIQHLAFESYAIDTSSAQRREWAKVQGRFEDISYVDSASASRALIAAALDHDGDETYSWLRAEAAWRASEQAHEAGLADVSDEGLLAACYPLHPSTLLALPALCARYGQNERTLFSFLASEEPRSVTTFTKSVELEGPLPWVRLEQVYDYFVESASTFVGASRDANRWVEIETTIRDAHGLTDVQSSVLKTIGVLNLVSAAGSVRASREVLTFALAGDAGPLETADEVAQVLEELSELGLVTYRDFASEYRIWQGSDFDITGLMTSMRRQVRSEALSSVLSSVMPLRATVASRHSIQSNTMRAFARRFADETTLTVDTPAPGDVRDGVLVYALASGLQPSPSDADVPVVVVEPSSGQIDALVDATVEVAALLRVLDDTTLADNDRAARRELSERLGMARQTLEQAVNGAFGVDGTWNWVNPPEGKVRHLKPLRGSDALSDVLDEVYSQAPTVAYEAVNRAELTSQGAKARRLLLEAALTPANRPEERLGLEGDGPEVGMYRAVYEDSGVHDFRQGKFGSPPDGSDWRPVWDHLNATLREGVGTPLSVVHVLDEMMRPPFGLRHGVATVLLTAGLIVNASDIAIYEHGTFKPRLDAAMSERMVRNPANFSLKYLAVTAPTSKRSKAVAALHAAASTALGSPTSVGDTDATVLSAVMVLLRPFHANSTTYMRKTKRFAGAWDDTVDTEAFATVRDVRDALVRTQEPDVLLFEALPAAVGYGTLPASGRGPDVMSDEDIDGFATAVASALSVIEGAYAALCGRIVEATLEAAQCNSTTMLAGDAAHLDDVQVLTSDVRTFAGLARMADSLDTTMFAQQVATAVTGTPPSEWADADIPEALRRIADVAAKFRRVSALGHARRSAHSGGERFDAFAVDITSSDGRPFSEVVVLRQSERDTLDAAVNKLISDMETSIGSEQVTARALLGLLADRLVASAKPVASDEDVVAPNQHSASS